MPQADYLGLTVPDPDLKWNDERGHYDFGAIDWDEFCEVVEGNGPCNRERLAARVKAWETARGCARRRWRMRDKAAPRARREGRLRSNDDDANEWPLWEIFIRSQHGLAHKHVGSLHAADAEMAIKNARDVYTRRNEGVSIWVVRSVRRSRRRRPATRKRCSSRPTTRSTGIRRSSRCPTK